MALRALRKILCSTLIAFGATWPSGCASLLTSESLSPGPVAEEAGGRSWIISLALYLPNRVIDAFDLVRAGVDVGPGAGVYLTATELAQVAALARTSVGLGYETLRHLPVKAASETALGLGPITADPAAGLAWYKSPTDLRVELHLAVVGAHAAVDPGEILDLFLGFIGLDPKGDDF